MNHHNLFSGGLEPLTITSLFAGAGGLDMGFENQGFRVLWANDNDKEACATHRLWSQAEVIHADIANVDFKTIPQTDVVLGGFPCQGFSLAGPRKLDDNRNTLYKYFVKLVEEKQPRIFVAENVKGILTLGKGAILEAIIADFAERGYNVFTQLVNAADYGVPQDRWRVIMLGIRQDLNIHEYVFPKPTGKRMTLKQAIGEMPEPSPEDVCQGGYSSRYMSRNRKRDWDMVSYTIPAMAKQVALHPSSPNMIKIGQDNWQFGEGVTRRLSWQEAAVIQTFPPDMEFVGSLTSKYRQIGNAVPVKLAEVIASDVKRLLESTLLSALPQVRYG